MTRERQEKDEKGQNIDWHESVATAPLSARCLSSSSAAGEEVLEVDEKEQIVPSFTNSHVLFNYRLAESLVALGHEVELWTQMEMAMLDTGNNRLPRGVEEHRVDIHFKDSLKVAGLKASSKGVLPLARSSKK